MLYSSEYKSPFGLITIASDGESIVGLWFEGQKYFGGGILDNAANKGNMSVIKAAKMWLDRYFAGDKPCISELPLNPKGSEFRQEVWRILCKIPYGEVITYGEIAKTISVKMGKTSMSSQAVGGAVGHNPISIIIPCHRVIGANGSLTGYAGGIDIKKKLLTLEGAKI